MGGADFFVQKGSELLTEGNEGNEELRRIRQGFGLRRPPPLFFDQPCGTKAAGGAAVQDANAPLTPGTPSLPSLPSVQLLLCFTPRLTYFSVPPIIRSMTGAPLLDMRGISKRFPGVVALDTVSLDVGPRRSPRARRRERRGQIHAHENPRRRLSARRRRHSRGRPARQIQNVTDAHPLGIAFIHQELNVLDNLDVAANVFLGREPLIGPFRLIDQKKIHADTEPFLKRLGLRSPAARGSTSFPSRSSKWSRSPRRFRSTRGSSSWTSRLRASRFPKPSACSNSSANSARRASASSTSRTGSAKSTHCADRVVVLRDGKNAGAAAARRRSRTTASSA